MIYRLTMSSVLLITSLSSAALSFERLTLEEYQRTKGQFFLQDLGVGETLQINLYDVFLCSKQGKLAVLETAYLYNDSSDYVAKAKVTFLPKKKVSLSITPHSKGRGVKKLHRVMLPVWSYRECDFFTRELGDQSLDILLVEDINGFKSERGYVNDLLSKGFSTD